MKSKITRVVYAEKKFLGNYETCEVTAEVTVDPEDNPANVMKRLKKWVAVQVDGGPWREEDEDEE